jgi:hypothetical protein
MNRCLLLLLGLCACKESESKIHRLSDLEVFLQEPTNMVDILWVVDNSQSMADEQAKIAARFDGFVTGINEAGVDWHIGVVSTDLDDEDQAGLLLGEPSVLTSTTPDYRELFGSMVQLGITGSDMEKGIDAAYKALSQPRVSGVNNGFRRNGAMLMINYFSDENDCSDRGDLLGIEDDEPCYNHPGLLVPVVQLIDDYRKLVTSGERLIVSAIVGPEISAGCEGAKPGSRYQTMADAFGGFKGDICDTSFGEIMEELGLQAGGMKTSFILKNFAVESTIEVWIDDEESFSDPEHGWTYDSQYHVIHFHGDGIPARGSRIQVGYEVLQRG